GIRLGFESHPRSLFNRLNSFNLFNHLTNIPTCAPPNRDAYFARIFIMNTAPIRVAVTGAAGQISYSLLFRIASGAMFGPNQPVILHLIELADEKAMAALQGVCMELDDCAFPLLKGIVPTSSLDEG